MNKDNFSFRKGATFHFEEEGHIINSWFSAFSGLEKVFIDGVLVSAQRNLSMKSDQIFELGDNVYKTEFSTKNIFKGPFVCTLYKNNNPYRIKKLILHDENIKTPFFMKLWFIMIVGFGYGVTSSILDFPNWAFVVFILAIFLTTYTYSKLHQKEIKIIEENV